MKREGRALLTAAAVMSLGVAALHVVIVFAGAGAYRYFGAPELAAAVERGSVLAPAALTLAIAAVFAAWGAWALSGAGRIRRLPLLRTALVAIGTVYALRGLLLVPELTAFVQGTLKYPRAVAFSSFALLAGACHLAGVARAWRSLGSRGPGTR